MKKVKLFEDYNITEKKITLSWNDDENSIVFSDGEIAQVDYDGEFKYRDEWFGTVDHTDAKDLIKDLQKRFKGDRFVWISEAYLNESKESDALANAINKSMIKIDDSMSYKDFALAVGKILKDEYGSHNFGPFMEVLHKDLEI